jgi:hypothetical protein
MMLLTLKAKLLADQAVSHPAAASSGSLLLEPLSAKCKLPPCYKLFCRSSKVEASSTSWVPMIRS